MTRLTLCLFCLLPLAGCRPDTAPHPPQGRWERPTPLGPGDPQEMSADYLEFDTDGTVLSLLRDNGRFLIVHTAAWSIPEPGRLEISGTCWRTQEVLSQIGCPT